MGELGDDRAIPYFDHGSSYMTACICPNWQKRILKKRASSTV